MVKKFKVISWCLFFLAVFDLGIGWFVASPLPSSVRDHDLIVSFLKEHSSPDALFLGSSRARDLDSLVCDATANQLRILSVSGGHISTFLEFARGGLERHFRRLGTWPEKMVLVLQPLDFEATENENTPSILWGWRDFVLGLTDGIGEPEKNFLRNRFFSWMRYSSLARDRNHRDALSKLVMLSTGRSVDAPSVEKALTQHLNKLLAKLNPREQQSLHALVTFLRSRSVSVKIIVMPFAPSVEDGLDPIQVARFQNYLQFECAREKCEFQVLKSAEVGLKDSDFTLDHIHLNPHGRHVISQALLYQGILANSFSP